MSPTHELGGTTTPGISVRVIKSSVQDLERTVSSPKTGRSEIFVGSSEGRNCNLHENLAVIIRPGTD